MIDLRASTSSRPTTPRPDWGLADWLAYQERLHPQSIALGLERVATVARAMGLIPADVPTLTVAGTNGKGSSAVLAAGIYRAAGYRVGCYTSPHLLRYAERIAIDGQPVEDAELCAAFAAVEAARAAVSLTYFEFGTLAALWLFRRRPVQVQVLEVGLGGRLDAVNVVDADCALLTNVGTDHRDWLGPDREAIGAEKAGVFRATRPAVVAEPRPPASVLRHARDIGADLRRAGRDFDFYRQAGTWGWRGRQWVLENLPPPGLSGEFQYRNAAGVLAAVEGLQAKVPVPESAVRSALPRLRLPGRLQRIGNRLYDVAHNAEAAVELARYLKSLNSPRSPALVLGMLDDKPVEAFATALRAVAGHVYCAGLPPPRGLDGAILAARVASVGLPATAHPTVTQALAAARADVGDDALIVVCGSFLTVAGALQASDSWKNP